MDTKFLLEKAKELLDRDKGLTPVLFIETDKALLIVALTGDFNNVDKRQLMLSAGEKFAKENPDKKIKSILMVSEANVAKVNVVDNSIIRTEAIVITKLNTIDNKKEILTQDFERTNNKKIIFKESHFEDNVPIIFILDTFMKGYYQVRQKDAMKYN